MAAAATAVYVDCNVHRLAPYAACSIIARPKIKTACPTAIVTGFERNLFMYQLQNDLFSCIRSQHHGFITLTRVVQV
jgi:hypothetical protein